MRECQDCTDQEAADKQSGGEIRPAPTGQRTRALMDRRHHAEEDQHCNDLKSPDHSGNMPEIPTSVKSEQTPATCA